MTAVELTGVSLSVGGRQVLRDISLTIADGEFIGVLGPNGAGKTTLLRALLGLSPADSGTIRVLGEPVRRGRPDVGYLPQTHGGTPAVALRGRDLLTVSLGGARFGMPLATAAGAREIDRALDLVDGRVLAERPLASLSGGERQRLLVAQALIGQPRLLLLDEPLIGLDPYQQQVVVSLVRRLSRALGLTVLFTAHELSQVLSVADRILYLGQGKAALGTVDEVIQPEVLSPLYGAPIEVVRAGGYIFVMSRGQDIERGHAHDHGQHHDHGDGHSHAQL